MVQAGFGGRRDRMIIRFDLLDENDFHGLSQGYVTLTCANGVVCSKNQSSMLFVQIPMFLDGIVTLLTTSTCGCEFPAIDSSFSFSISKFNKKIVKVVYRTKVMEQMTNEELVQSVWAGVQELLSRYPQLLTHADEYDTAIAFNTALDAFKITIGV